MINALDRPTCFVVKVKGETAPPLTYRLHTRTREEAVSAAIADYNRLFRVSDGVAVSGEQGR